MTLFSALKRFQLDPAKVPLRLLLVLPFVLQTVGAAALVGYFSYRNGQKAVESLASQLMDQVSSRVSDRLDTYLQTPQKVVASNLTAFQREKRTIDGVEQQRIALWQQMNSVPFLPTSYIATEQGRQYGYGRIQSQEMADYAKKMTGENLAIGTLYFSEVDKSKSNQRRYYLVDAQGNPTKLAYTHPADFQATPWYRQAKANPKQSWSPIFTYLDAPILGIMAMAPIRDGTGNFQGVFVSATRLSDISKFLSTMDFAQDGQVFIMEHSGDLVATSTLENSFAGQQNRSLLRLPAVNCQDAKTKEIAQQLKAHYQDFRTIQTAQQLSLTANNQQQFVKVAPYRDTYGLDWLVVTVVPASQFMAQIQAQNVWTGLFCLGTLLGATGLGLLAARRITAPLQRLNQSAHKIAQQEFDPSFAIGGLGEVRQLSISLKQMAGQLQAAFQLRTHYQQQLEEQVRERTVELQRSRDLREAIFNESTDAIFLVELPPTSCILDCNQRAVELFAVASKAELIGTQGSDLQKAPFTPAELADIAAEIEQKGVWSREVEYLTKTGKSFWGSLAAKSIQIAGQTVRMVRLTDISERKQQEADRIQAEIQRQQAEVLLRQSEERFRLIFEKAGMGIVICPAPDFKLALSNQFFQEFLGYSGDELATMTWENLTHPEDMAAEEVLAQECFAGVRDSYQVEKRYIHKNGMIRWGNLIVSCIRNETGQIQFGFAMVKDITDRKQAETALRDSDERFRRAFEDAAIGMALVALDGKVLQVNRALCNILGYGEAALMKMGLQELTHPDDLEENLTLIQQVMIGKRHSYQMEKRYIHQRGHLIWAILSVSAIRDQQGTPLYFVSQVQDISDRHKVDQIKDEFISVVSHELRTPLTAIRGSLGILETGIYEQRPEKAKYMLRIAINNSDRLMRLVNDILDLERLEAGAAQFVMATCQVSELLQQAIELMQPIAQQASIDLRLISLTAEIWAAPDAIVQTLTNLLSNAIKFSPPGSIVQLKAEIVSPDILFSVTDQGRGIPANQLEKIFGRFQQVDISDSRQKGGTGLGLAICQSIVQQHRGRIWAESIVTQGSTFYFMMPISPDQV